MSWFSRAFESTMRFITRVTVDPRPAAIASQIATRDPSHPLKKIASTADIAVLFKRVKFTDDALGGVLDVVPHPQAFQRAIDLGMPEHPHEGYDCSGYGIWCCAEILKSQLADVVYYATAFYTYVSGPRSGEKAGHAVCVYKDKVSSKPHWIGNWHGGVPMELSSPESWVDALEHYGAPADQAGLKVRQVYRAQRSYCVLQSDDTVVFASMTVDRG